MAGEWWNSDIGGYKNAVNDPGGLGVSSGTPATGMTWGQLMQSFANANYPYGQSGGGTAPIGGLPNYAPPKQNMQIYQLPGMKQGSAQGEGDDWSTIMQVIMGMFGGAAGAAGSSVGAPGAAGASGLLGGVNS